MCTGCLSSGSPTIDVKRPTQEVFGQTLTYDVDEEAWIGRKSYPGMSVCFILAPLSGCRMCAGGWELTIQFSNSQEEYEHSGYGKTPKAAAQELAKKALGPQFRMLADLLGYEVQG